MAPTFGGMSGRPLRLSIVVMSTMGFLLFGYDQGVMSGIISGEQYGHVFHAVENDKVMQATVTAIYEVGCLIGAVWTLIFGDMTGRRYIIMAGAAVMIIGVIIQVASMPGAIPLLQFCFGRVITGIGNGMNTATIPTWQAECSKANKRGLLICIEGGTVAIGTLISYWIVYGAHWAKMSNAYSYMDVAWRFPIAFQIVFGFIIVIGMIWMPESPRFLLRKDRVPEGEYIMAALLDKEVDDPEVQGEKDRALESIQAAGATSKASFRDLLTGGPTQHFRRMLIGSSSQFFQQISGCNAVIYYLPVLLESSLGESHDLSLLIGGFNMVVYAVFATFSWFFVEYIGRRKLFFWGSVSQFGSMVICFACLIPLVKEPNNKGPPKGTIFGFFWYMATFGATWLPLPWLYPAEINPTRTRTQANAVSTCTNWLFNFTVVMITPVMVQNIKWGTYLFFAAWNGVMIPAVYFFYPETSGRTLEEIDMIFEKGFAENMSYITAAKELPPLAEIIGNNDDPEKGTVENTENVEKASPEVAHEHETTQKSE